MESTLIAKMLVPELRKKLNELGLDSKGLKADLVARLNEYYEALRQKRLKCHNTFVDEDEEEEEAEEKDQEDEDDDEDEDQEVSTDREDVNQSETEEGEVEVEVVTHGNPIQNLVTKIVNATKRGKNTDYNLVKNTKQLIKR